MKIVFRPHHFLCTLGFQGIGYSPHFVENYKKIVEEIQKDEKLSIQVVVHEDSICKACPHQRIEGCSMEEKIQGLDARHAKILRLKQGDVLNWAEAKQRLKDHMTLDNFHQACSGCEWQPLGVCEAALKKLRI